MCFNIKYLDRFVVEIKLSRNKIKLSVICPDHLYYAGDLSTISLSDGHFSVPQNLQKSKYTNTHLESYKTSSCSETPWDLSIMN